MATISACFHLAKSIPCPKLQMHGFSFQLLLNKRSQDNRELTSSEYNPPNEERGHVISILRGD